jgi:hypothetical protein
MERRESTPVEEPKKLLLHGCRRNLEMPQLLLNAKHFQELLTLVTRTILNSTLSTLDHSILIFSLTSIKLTLMLKTRLDSSISKMINAERVSESIHTQHLFSSDNSRPKSTPTLVQLIRMNSPSSTSHLWSQPFSNSLKKKSKLSSDNNKTP